MAHDGNHADGAHGHAAHHDVSDDKGAAFVGFIAGVVLLGSFLFGMVRWTNHHLNAEKAGAPAAESTK